jgi:hypothetical protein
MEFLVFVCFVLKHKTKPKYSLENIHNRLATGRAQDRKTRPGKPPTTIPQHGLDLQPLPRLNQEARSLI